MFALGIVGATALLYPAPPVEDWGGATRAGFVVAFLSCVPLGLLYAAAFAGSGLVLGVLLSAPELPTRRLYGLDLTGSALGAFAVIPAVAALGAERAAVAAAAALLAGALVLAPPRTVRVRALAAAAAVALAAVALAAGGMYRDFSESYLYTAEAVDLYLSRLAPGGILNVMRPEPFPPRDMLRMSRDGRAGTGRAAVFFGALGLGYMAVEMALIQKLGLLLGHPNLALSVVLASLLLATGAGSLASAAVVRAASGSLRLVSCALSLVLLGELLLAFPRLGRGAALPGAGRVALAAALVAPVGFLLGVYFPTGLDRLKRTSPALVPWAWGLNGMASVIAPILAVAVSMTAGISRLFLAAVPVYLVAGLAAAPVEDAPAPVGDPGSL